MKRKRACTFDVAVHDPVLVQLVDSAQDALGVPAYLSLLQSQPRHLLKGTALTVLHEDYHLSLQHHQLSQP